MKTSMDRILDIKELDKSEFNARVGLQEPEKPIDCIVFYEDQAPLKKIIVKEQGRTEQLRQIEAAEALGLQWEGDSANGLLYIEKRKYPNVYVCHYKGPNGELIKWINGEERMTDAGPEIIKPGHTRTWCFGFSTLTAAVPTLDMNAVKEYLQSKNVKFDKIIELPWEEFKVIDETRLKEVQNFQRDFAQKIAARPTK